MQIKQYTESKLFDFWAGSKLHDISDSGSQGWKSKRRLQGGSTKRTWMYHSWSSALGEQRSGCSIEDSIVEYSWRGDDAISSCTHALIAQNNVIICESWIEIRQILLPAERRSEVAPLPRRFRSTGHRTRTMRSRSARIPGRPGHLQNIERPIFWTGFQNSSVQVARSLQNSFEYCDFNVGLLQISGILQKSEKSSGLLKTS